MGHPLCRPKHSIEGLKKRAPKTGRWLNDDGKPGEVFFGIDPVDGPSVWVADCSCKIHGECPASVGLNKACLTYDGIVGLKRLPPVRAKTQGKAKR